MQTEIGAPSKQLSKEERKALIQDYLEAPKKVGIYCIRNTKNEKRFVAESRDIDARINRHRFELRNNVEKFGNSLQQDWNTDGADAFEFLVLETIEPQDEPNYDPTEELNVLLEMWIEQLQPFAPNGYN